jgi:acetoin utilization protein AcuB
MFVWVNQGIAEPYIPRIRHDQIKKVTPLFPGSPERPVEIEEHNDTVEISKGHSGDGRFVAGYYSKEEQPRNDERKQVFLAKDIMSKNLITLNSKDKVSEVEEIFNSRRFRHLPVLDPEEKLVGILSERDLLKFTIESLRRQDVIDWKNTPIGEIMKRKILTAFPDTPIREIAKIMFEERVGSVPILQRNTHVLVGLVTRSDILRRVMNNPPLDLYS